MRLIAFVAAAFLAFSPVMAGEEADLLKQFEGEWQASGEMFGMPAEFSASWAPALDGAMMRHDYLVRINPGTDEASTFQGVAYFSLSDRPGFDAFWADNSGRVRPIKTRLKEGALMSDWGGYGDEEGRTQYRLMADGSMEIRSWVLDDGEWREFSAETFVKTGP